MPPPVLELTHAMVGPNRTDMTRAYLTSLMYWPDDPAQQREVMKTAAALHLRATLGTVPAARDAIADHVDMVSMALDALPPRKIRESAEQRYYQGCLAGEFLSEAFADDLRGRPVKLEHYKAAMTAPRRRKLHERMNISRSTLVNTILPRFRPVAHLWAAHVYAGKYLGDRELPCSVARVPEFLLFAEIIRERALAMKFPKRRDALLREDEAWTLPPGLPLPETITIKLTV